MALLNPDKLTDQYKKALTGMRTYWDPFDEYERISRNRPHPKVVAAKLPTVTDGTLAGIIIAQPKRIIQRIPTGGIVSVDQPELAEIADYIWQNEIIPNANTNGDVIQKSWVMMSKALTYGCAASYAFFKSDGDYFGSDFKIIYIKDIILERGKVFGPDCNVLYMRQWYTELDIQRIIDKERKLAKRSKRRKDAESYQSTWNIKRLKELKRTQAKAKDPSGLNPSEKEKSPDAKFIQIIHAFQKGIKQPFYSFSPDLPEDQDLVRTWVNPDPRGKMPINFLYADIDLSNPLGRGHVELSGGMQNLIDSEVQSFQLMQKLMLNPPLMKWGNNIRGATVKYKPNAVWDMGSDPNSKIEPVDIKNYAIENFANNYGMMKNQVLALTHNQETGVGGTETGGTQSKTHAGVQQVNQVIGFDDNYMRKQFESWYQDNAECMLNLHFALNMGTRDIDLTEDWLQEKMPNMQPNQAVDINEEKKQATIAYGQVKTRLKFKVDPTSSEDVDTDTQVEHLKELLNEASSNPYLYYYMLNDGFQMKLGEAYRNLFKRLGVEGIDKIIVKMPTDDPSAQQLRGVLNPLYDKPKIDVSYQDLPPMGQIQAAANAGITLSLADVLAGPVIDPNVRGTGQNAAIPGIQDPIMNPAYAQPAPQPEAIPATPPGMATQPTTQVPTGANEPAPPQPGIAPAALPQGPPPPQAPLPPQAPQAPLPPQGAPPEGPRLSPEDTQLAHELLKAGYSPQQVVDAIDLMHQGKNQQEILQAIGQPGAK